MPSCFLLFYDIVFHGLLAHVTQGTHEVTRRPEMPTPKLLAFYLGMSFKE